MLFNILNSGGGLLEKLLLLMISIISLLPALTLHEWAHGYMAYKLGDNTAKADGRLSLNPLDHLDPAGTLMMLLVGFGWAKPVPVNTRYFKKPRRDFALTSLAGPLMNFIAAFVSALLYVLTLRICIHNGFVGMVPIAIEMVFYYSMMLNLGLGLFNLIPLPPLDGSNILMCLLPHRAAAKYSTIRYYTQYIFIGLIVLQYVPMLDFIPDLVFWPLESGRDLFANLFCEIADMIFSPIFSNL